MKLVLSARTRYIHLTAGNGVAGGAIGKLRDDADLDAAGRELRRINRDIINPLRGKHGADAKRREAAREALQGGLA